MADVAVNHFRSRDLDETLAFLGQFGHQTRVPHGRDPFAYELAGAASRGLTAVHIKVAARQAMRADDRSPMLFLPLRSGYTFHIGRKAWQPDPSRAIFIAADHEYSAHAPAGAFLGLRVDGDLLCREISGRMRGRARPLLLKSVEIPIDAGRLATLRAICDRMFAVGKGAHPWGAYDNVDTFEAEVASWVAGLVIEQSGALRSVATRVGECQAPGHRPRAPAEGSFRSGHFQGRAGLRFHSPGPVLRSLPPGARGTAVRDAGRGQVATRRPGKSPGLICFRRIQGRILDTTKPRVRVKSNKRECDSTYNPTLVAPRSHDPTPNGVAS